MAVSEKAASLVQRWLELDQDAASRAEVQAWLDAGDEATISRLLGRRLEFGTAGLRGRMGPGFNQMNSITVQQTTQGLVRYLQREIPERLQSGGVVIGFDGRHHSAEFARVAAAVFVSQGVRVALFSGPLPTPFVAAGVVTLGAAAGIMVTASHNPKDDNGYKVYWANGCQIIPPQDEGIAACILEESQGALWALPALPLDAPGGRVKHPLVVEPSAQVLMPYYHRLSSQLRAGAPEVNQAAERVVYTALHGVGTQALTTAFQVVGLPPPILVQQQALPNPDFPTVTFPNPEEGAGTWDLAFQEGRAHNSRLVIANDPDADRFAAAEADATAPGGYRPFTGNEIGALLADWLWSAHRRKHPQEPASQCVLLASVVSSAFLGAMAAKEGFRFEQTLTGFKFIGNRALDLEAEGYRVILGYEEAIGFMPGAMFRDKDGVATAVAFCELAAHLYASGSSLQAHLEGLYRRYGRPAFRSGYFISDDPAKSQAVFARLRKDGQYPQAVGGARVTWVRDLGVGLDTRDAQRRTHLPWRPGDMMVTFGLEAPGSPALPAVLTLRASGTEPKLKFYLEVLPASGGGGEGGGAPGGEGRHGADEVADALVVAVDQELVQVDRSGLKRRAAA